MYTSKVKLEYIRFRKKRICQGDILKDLTYVIGEPTSKVEAEIDDESTFEYAIVMNQDCDLNQDFDQRQESHQRDSRNIRSVLLCPGYPAQKFYQGNHITKWSHPTQNDRMKEKIEANNEMKRYHYIKGDIKLGVPELVIDFKHFYTVPVDLVYRQRKLSYMATIGELYREELSQRFAYFLSRIGLPGTV